MFGDAMTVLDPATLMGPLWTLLAYIALGWLAARRLAIDPRPIATLLIYLVAPLTFFRGLVQGGPTPDYLLLTLRSEEHTSELQSRPHLVCRLLLEKKNTSLPESMNACC